MRRAGNKITALCVLLLWFTVWVTPTMGANQEPFTDAVAVWHMADLKDSARAGSDLTPNGDVSAGIELSGAERNASLARGGDGRVARFASGYLDARQGGNGALNVAGRAFTLCVRLRDPSGDWMTPLISKHGGHDKLIYNLFSHDFGDGKVIGFELGMDGNQGVTQVIVPLKMIGATDWHDIACRFDGIRLQFFVDGVLMDEAFAPRNARLRQGNSEPCLIGAERVEAVLKSGWRGLIDHAAIWSRAISDAEIERLSGGPDPVNARRAQYLGASLPSMQYFRPHNQFNVGDTMPFFHGDENGGTFHFVYLLDRGHHSARGGLGAHQWAHVTSRDLIHWTGQPLIVPIERDDEGSICTGSMFFHGGTYYAFYATRGFDRIERLSMSSSDDGVHFVKTEPNPFLAPGEKYVNGFRDPHVFRDQRTGLLHLLVSTMLKEGKRGCLAHYTSPDLKRWSEAEPFLVEGNEVPECPDYFEFNGWYYLLFSNQQVARYRLSRNPLGPWERPKVEVIDGGAARVMKTAAFTGNRRIGTASIWPHGYAGWAVFRELVQSSDGRLGSKFVPEMIPATVAPVALNFESLSDGVSGDGRQVRIVSGAGAAQARLVGLPLNGRVRLRIDAKAAGIGLRLRSTKADEPCHELRFDPPQQKVSLARGQSLTGVEGLDRPFSVDIVLKDNLLDLCINEQRTLLNWVPSLRGDGLILSVEKGQASFSEVTVSPLR